MNVSMEGATVELPSPFVDKLPLRDRLRRYVSCECDRALCRPRLVFDRTDDAPDLADPIDADLDLETSRKSVPLASWKIGIWNAGKRSILCGRTF